MGLGAFGTSIAHREAATAPAVDILFDVPGSTDLSPLVRLALACVEREYPNQTSILLRSPDDLRLPELSTPAFRGCFDWHSAVHSHWLGSFAAYLITRRGIARGAAP